ncbi:uncharacterized protein [Macrobrachium rosenbergii]|uniref:uncharacterized protein isoform X1 n=1 Tax=Macrobrachium rosenbergii TaxID=79674 RepID=UPI0034D5F586
MKIREIFILTTVLINTKYGLCICYFPGELQGVWATQKSVTTSSRGTRSPIAYQEVTLEADVILQWGMCHAREDNYVILKDNTGGARCFRCIYLNVASPRVVQVWTMGLETCYTSEEAARSTCPPTQAIASKSAREIMLYKVRSAFGEPEVSEVECPLNGRFTFTYRRGHSGASTSYCSQQTSEFSNCPYGIGFNVLYKDCSFPSPLRSGLQCLGSWIGEDGVDYLAVTDTSVKEGDDAPQFKCGMFHEEVGTGRVFLAFSEDSTCTNSLKSPRDGYETYEMMSTPPPPLPPFVSQAACKFPKSLMGHWHHTYVADDTVVFKDYRNFKTYSARCVKDMNDGERYIVYARSHCGDWSYNCLWLKRRSANVLEFMLGLYPRETFDDLLCEVDKFGDMTSWTTQGKSLLEEPTTCPIVGNYVGVLPDASGICAQLYSDCSNPQIMFYTVSDCSNFSAIYEREDLPGPTSEAGPWLPPEQKVSTGAVLTIVDDTHRRGRRQVSEGHLRVANALTTTISWLWGSSTTPETTTTALGTTTTTTTTTTTSTRPYAAPERQRPQPPLAESPLQNRDYERRMNRDPLQNRDYERRVNPDPLQNRDHERRLNPDLFPEDGYHQSNTPLPEPPKQDRYDAVGFWPRNRNEHEYSFERTSSPAALATTPPVFVPGPIREVNSDPDPGVPGRATWVPGSPPGFNSQSTLKNQQIPRKEESFAHEISHVHSPLASQASVTRTHDDSSFLAASVSNRQPLKQEREYQCLGQWEEEGRIYALTYRRDIRTYECFVGIIRSNGVVFIKEAGTECSRGVQPEVLGMKLHRKGDSCPQPSPTSQANKSPPKEDTRPRTTQPPWLRTTRPWKPITAALTIENQVVSCKVGMECKSAGKEESSPEKFSLFMKRQTDKRRVHQINLRKNKLASENAIMKRLLNSVRLENRKEVGSLKKSFEVMLKRSKRESHEKAPVLKNSESGASSNKDNDFPYSDGGQHENEMHYKGHSLADPKTEHNSEIVHLTTTSDTYAEESLQARDPEIGKRKKENLCESSCQQTNDNEEHMKGLDSTGDANNSQNKDTMTFIPTTDHLKFTTEFANNRRAIASLYPLSENNDSYINFNHSFSSVDMANDTLLNFENHNRSQRVGISLSHLHSPSHWSIDVHEDDSMKYTKSVQYLDPYTPILLNYKPGTTEMGSNTAHLEPKDLESVHSHGEDFVHSQGENFDDSGHNHRDPHELESSYDDHDDQLQNNDHIHKEKHATLHGHRYETDYIHPPIDKLGIREEDASGNVDDTNMHDYTDDPDNENSHAQADSLTNVEGIVPRSGHIHKDDLAHKDAHDDHKDEHAILTGHGQAHEQDHTSDDHHGQYHQTYRAIPFANKSAPISENHTVEHDEITRHIMPQIDEDFPILLQSEDSNGDYPDPNVTKGCNDGGLENLSSIQNTTNIFQVANCSDEWMNFENGTTEIEVETTTEDSDIPKIPISLLEYPTVLPTTVKPSHVTLPPMIWQPFAQPGRPRHRGSGSSGISASSEPLLIGLISFLCIFSNRA